MAELISLGVVRASQNRNKFVQTHELIQHALCLMTPLLRIEIFFSIVHIKRESICQPPAERGGGAMEHGMGGRSVAHLSIRCLLHFCMEIVMPACGACVQIKWRDRKMHY